MKNIFSYIIISSAIFTTIPAMACERLPVGKDICKAACKVIYKDGLPEKLCEMAAQPPHSGN